MSLKMLFFGSCADASGNSETTENATSTLEELKQQLLAKYPKLKNQKFSIAVNQKITSENIVLKDGDVIALIPPFSGG